MHNMMISAVSVGSKKCRYKSCESEKRIWVFQYARWFSTLFLCAEEAATISFQFVKLKV